MLIIVNKKVLRLCIDCVFLSEEYDNILNILFHCLQNECTTESASSPIRYCRWQTKQTKPTVLMQLLLIFIGVQLLYNVVFVSTVQQSESTICIHISPLFWISFSFR